MRTRRKSKAAAAAAAADLDAEDVAPSDAGTASQTRVDFSVSIPDDIDSDYLSTLLPGVSFDVPSPDTILALYRLVVTQSLNLETALHDLEESRAENERKDVELDQALQDRESSVSSLEAQVKGLQEELTKAKQDRDTLGKFGGIVLHPYLMYLSFSASSKSNLESQISTLNSSHSVSSTELDSFKHRVEDTEREKRDLLGVVSRLKEDSAQRDGAFSPLSFYVSVPMNIHQRKSKLCVRV